MRTLAIVLALGFTGCKPESAAPAPPAPAPAASAKTADGVPVKEVAVTDKGYEPARVEVQAGKPVVLRFTRKTKDTCGEALVIQGDPVAKMLPFERPVDVRLTPAKTGEIAFACGMNMMHGVIFAR